MGQPFRPNYALLHERQSISAELQQCLLARVRGHGSWVDLAEYDFDRGLGSHETPRRVEVSKALDLRWRPEEQFSDLLMTVKRLWALSAQRFSDVGVSRYARGSKLPPHIDTSFSDGRLITCLLYLSTAHGGELVFPSIDYVLTPSARDLVVFPSNLPHSVSEVSGGERVVLVWFGQGGPAVVDA